MEPIQGVRFIHTAIRRETAHIEDLVAPTTTPDQAKALAKRIDWLTLMIHKHTEGEEVALFARLEEKEKNVAAHYLHDHKAENALMDEMKKLAVQLQTETGEQAAATRALLQRHVTALRHHTHLHVEKEETIVIPLALKHFAPPEQGAIVKHVMSFYTPDELREMLPWIINWLTPEDRAAYVNVIKMGMPAPAFAAAKDWIRSGTSLDVWSDLQKRVPELA